MVKRIFVILAAVITLYTSCASLPDTVSVYDFSVDTQALPVLYTSVISHEHANEKDWLVLQGVIDDDPPSIFHNIFYQEGSVSKRTWEGRINYNHEEHPIQIESHALHVGKFIDYDDYSVADDPELMSLIDINITGLPTYYQTDTFSPPVGGGRNFKPLLYLEELPAPYITFNIDNKKFTVMLTTLRFLEPVAIMTSSEPTPAATYQDMFLDEQQVYQIVDEFGTVYAEFTTSYYEYVTINRYFLAKYEYRDGSYTLFDVDPDFDETKLIPGIAVVDILKYMMQWTDIAY